jgi:hypothetical protein
MNIRSLSLEQAPDISTPLRFFLTAPLFAMAAILVWLLGGDDLLNNRWLPQSLAFTHLITLGFITMIMMGALFQILPVLSGKTIAHGDTLSKLVHALFTPGVACLAAGFYFQNRIALICALFLIGSALLLFLLSLSRALFTTPVNNASLLGLRFAVTALWIGAGLGMWLLLGHTLDDMVLARQHTSLHIAWAALGWVTTMIISIAFQVIPMFQVTQDYPAVISHGMVPSLFILLGLWTFGHLAGFEPWLHILLATLICILLIAFVSITSQLQIQRKKRTADASLYFWFSGLLGIFASMLMFLYAQSVDKNLDGIVALTFFLGFVIAIINAMLYKIVPFLVWFNLTRKLALSPKRKLIPLMHEIIQPAQAMTQFMAHAAALVLTLIASLTSEYVLYAAMVLWLLNFTLLWLNLMGAVKVYRNMAVS